MYLIPVRTTLSHHPRPHIFRTSQAFCAIFFGPTLTRISLAGQRMTVVSPLRSVRTLYQDSCKNMTWT